MHLCALSIFDVVQVRHKTEKIIMAAFRFTNSFFALFQMRQWWQGDRTIDPRLLVWFFFLDKLMKIKIQRDRFLRSAYRLRKSNPGVKGQCIRFRVHGDEPASGMSGQRKHYLKDLENHPGPDTFPDII